MEYYIGIEGGGTKTVAALGNSEMEIIASTVVGATNYHSMGLLNTKEEFNKIFTHFKEEQNIGMESIKGVCFGGAGIDCKDDEIQIRKLFDSLGYNGKLLVCNDSYIALAGANNALEGAMIISGTGSIALGIDVKGEAVRVGGWGHIIDDGGSGYAMAVDCLNKIVKSYDGRGSETLLWDKVKEKLGVSHQEELISFVYGKETYKQHIAELAVCVLELHGIDHTADVIIKNAIDSLWEMVRALSSKMGSDEFSLSLGGSLLQKSELFRNLFEKEIKKHLPKVKVQLPYKDAVYGALKLAMKQD